MLKEEPIRTKFLIDMLLPRLNKSRTDPRPPSSAVPRRDSVVPTVTAFLAETALPNRTNDRTESELETTPHANADNAALA
jgi:hypothetical protein